MSGPKELFETLIAADPDFQPRYQEFLSDWQGQEIPWYLAMGELAHYIVEAYEQGKTHQYQDLFSAIELVLPSADSGLQNLICVGLFEDTQNIASHRSFGASVFRSWLGPRSLIAWDEVDRGMQQVAAWASEQGRDGDSFGERAGLDAESALAQVENPELRRIIEQIYRKKGP